MSLDEKARQDELRAKKEQEQIERRNERRFREDQDKRLRDKEEMKKTLAQQIHEKENKVLEKQRELVVERAQMEVENKAAEKRQRKKADEIKKRNLFFKHGLENQIEETEKRRKRDGASMTEAELKINKALLQKLAQ